MAKSAGIKNRKMPKVKMSFMQLLIAHRKHLDSGV